MQIVSWLVIFSQAILICTHYVTDSIAEDLKMIQVIFRHGERSPDQSGRTYYPLDKSTNETWYPEGWDGLTNNGKKSVYDFGLFLKERYGQWLGNVYLKDEVVFRSSTYDRAIMSTQIVAAALFPPVGVQRWDSNFDWQPIPVYSESSQLHSLYLTPYRCETFLAMRRELEKTDQFLINRTEELSEDFEFIRRNVGYEIQQEHANYIYQYLYGLLNENVELPEWANGIFPEGKLEKITAYDYVIQSYNKTLVRLNGGRWIREWLQNVDNYLNDPNKENGRAVFYGGHEVNISGVLAALGLFDDYHIPFYCSALMFELFKTEDKFHVKILYRNKGVLRELLIPGCDRPKCSLEKFRQLLTDVIPNDETAALCP